MSNTNYKLLHNRRSKPAIEGLWMRIEVRLRLGEARSLYVHIRILAMRGGTGDYNAIICRNF